MGRRRDVDGVRGRHAEFAKDERGHEPPRFGVSRLSRDGERADPIFDGFDAREVVDPFGRPDRGIVFRRDIHRGSLLESGERDGRPDERDGRRPMYGGACPDLADAESESYEEHPRRDLLLVGSPGRVRDRPRDPDVHPVRVLLLALLGHFELDPRRREVRGEDGVRLSTHPRVLVRFVRRFERLIFLRSW